MFVKMQSLDHLYQSHLRWHFLRQVKIPRAGWGLLDQSLWRWCLRVIVFKQHLQQFVSMLKCKRRTSFFLDWFVQQVPLHHSTRHTREFNKHSLITLCHGVAHKILTVAFAHRSYIAFFFKLTLSFLLTYLGFSGGSDGKASTYNVGDLGLIPGSRRSPGEGNGNSLQNSCLENPMDRGSW